MSPAQKRMQSTGTRALSPQVLREYAEVPCVHCGINDPPRGHSMHMPGSISSVCLLLCAILAIVLAGCLSPGTGNPGASAPPPSLYSRGDVLSGDMASAGYDTPDPNIDGVRAVVLAYQPGTDMYVYTFVRAIPDGNYSYVFPEGWEARLARPRPAFEGYGLEKVGTIPGEHLWNV